MIDTFFYRPAVRRRLATGLLGSHLAALAATLQEQGYAAATIRTCLSAGDKLGRWLVAHQLPLTAVTNTTVARYRRQIGRRSKAAQGLGLVVQYLRQHGLITDTTQPAAPDAREQWLQRYADYLHHVRGLADNTRAIYARIAKRFLVACFPPDRVEWRTVTARQITDFVQRETTRRQGHGRKEPAVALRALLRFVVFSGERPPGLAGAVPTPRQWVHSALPAQLTATEIHHLLAVSQGDSPAALRNYAMLLLLARLGLRAREVARLRLEDLDWASGHLLIRPGKTHQARSLPLSQEVGDAIVAYLLHARPPTTDSRVVFLRLRPPFRPFVSSCGVSHLVHRAMEQAALPVRPRMGAHLFRHTLASRLVQYAASFKAVADVLGHRSLQTTGIYAKLDLPALAAVALPWGGGA